MRNYFFKYQNVRMRLKRVLGLAHPLVFGGRWWKKDFIYIFIYFLSFTKNISRFASGFLEFLEFPNQDVFRYQYFPRIYIFFLFRENTSLSSWRPSKNDLFCPLVSTERETPPSTFAFVRIVYVYIYMSLFLNFVPKF